VFISVVTGFSVGAGIYHGLSVDEKQVLMNSVSKFSTYHPAALSSSAPWVYDGIPGIKIANQRHTLCSQCPTEERDVMQILSCGVTRRNIV
jgi:hypothetical protein